LEPVKNVLTEDLPLPSYEHTSSPPKELTLPYNDNILENPTAIMDGGSSFNQGDIDDDPLTSASLPSSHPDQDELQARPQHPQSQRQPPSYLEDYVLS